MLKWRPRHWIAAVLVLSASIGAQQPGSIRGVVRDKDFDAPLAGVQVTNVETAKAVATSDQGAFVFSQVPPGKYTLLFSKDGYARLVRADVVVLAGRLTDVDAALSGEFTEMEEFVVQDLLQFGGGTEAALLQLRFANPALLDSIGADLISRAGVSDAASALRLVAGASVQDGKSAVIRGLPDRYVSSQMNGVRLPTADEDKRAVELDQFPAAVIESIQVSKTFTPDQQGDASGGAVNLRLKGIPDETSFGYKIQTSVNSQVAQAGGDFLTYDGGGVNFWGKDDGSRAIQEENLGSNWEGAVGVTRDDVPLPDYKWSLSGGHRHTFDNGLALGGSLSFFYERETSFFDNGTDDSYWVEHPGEPMSPKVSQGTVEGGDFRTALFDVTQGSQLVQWGGLATLGVEIEDHSIGLTWLYSHTAEDTATLAEDTRGKQFFFPGYDPNDPTTPGHTERNAAPYLRLETLDYTERTTGTLQLNGRHKLPGELAVFHDPELDWTVAKSFAGLDQPDKRQFASAWFPERVVGPPGQSVTIPARYQPYKPDAQFSLGNLQRIWKNIEEDSQEYFANLKLPFEQWSGDEGYLKFGGFYDRVDRTFDQNSFSNFNDNSEYEAPFTQFWSAVFPFQNHPITESLYDVDYDGEQTITAAYGMIDLPLTSWLNVIGGARFESTEIGVVNHPEELATWFPPGSLAPTELNPGDADVSIEQDDVLPSIGLVIKPIEQITLRASYNETIARQTFKELTPIIQQEYLGGPIFIGNPDLRMSSLRNYDLRIDYVPYDGSLLSASWFHKDVEDPIEYVQKIATFDYTTAVNYPEGKLTGWEFELRQSLGHFWDPLQGLSLGGNVTLIQSEVTLPADEAAQFSAPNVMAPMTTRDMTGAPEYLYNIYLTYDLAATGTQAAAFYTVQGDTLVEGAGTAGGRLVPNVYALEYGTLNVTLSQRLADWIKLQVQAKNLTDPNIETVYRSPVIGGDVTKTFYTKGIDFSIGLSGEVKF